MEVLRLHPLSQAELNRTSPSFLNQLFSGNLSAVPPPIGRQTLVSMVCTGGFPGPLARRSHHRRLAWHRAYIDTLLQRDVRDLSRIGNLDVLPRLLAAAAAQTATFEQHQRPGGPFRVTRPTIRDYITLLEHLFLLEHLPAWHANRLKRLVKTPKLHMGDTGVSVALLGHDEHSLFEDRNAFGPLLETFVYQELRRQASGRPDLIRFFHYRDKDKFEVDIVLERGPRTLAGVEIKSAATVRENDFRGLQKLQKAAKDRFTAGVVLYDGEHILPFGDRLFAVPLRSLWEEERPSGVKTL